MEAVIKKHKTNSVALKKVNGLACDILGWFFEGQEVNIWLNNAKTMKNVLIESIDVDEKKLTVKRLKSKRNISFADVYRIEPIEKRKNGFIRLLGDVHDQIIDAKTFTAISVNGGSWIYEGQKISIDFNGNLLKNVTLLKIFDDSFMVAIDHDNLTIKFESLTSIECVERRRKKKRA